VELIADEMFGHMVSLMGGTIQPVPISSAVGRIRTVPPHGDLVRTGRALGISFGNEVQA
jgi:6-phosphofructokinase 1